MLDGTTVVVSPLIALMKDQLDTLRERGVTDVIALNSTLSEDQEAAARARVAGGTVKILYTTPEKLEDEGFLDILKSIRVPLFVVDEAHCISQWDTISSGLPCAWTRHFGDRASARTRADRDGDAVGSRGHPAPARHRARQADRQGLRPAELDLSGAQGGQRGRQT